MLSTVGTSRVNHTKSTVSTVSTRRQQNPGDIAPLTLLSVT